MRIQVLVGTIASGKSTYAKKQARDGWIIINDDALVNAVHGDQYGLYQRELKPLYKGLELCILHTAIAMGRDVLVDKGLNLTRNARQRWVAVARSLDVPIDCVLFPFSSAEVHAARRVASDHRGHSLEYWQKVAEHHISVYEPPTIDEGFVAIHPW